MVTTQDTNQQPKIGTHKSGKPAGTLSLTFWDMLDGVEDRLGTFRTFLMDRTMAMPRHDSEAVLQAIVHLHAARASMDRAWECVLPCLDED
jgi:hypothetical protein